MVFDDICKQLSSNIQAINLLIHEKIINFPYCENELGKDIIKLQRLIILKLQNPEIEIDVSIGGKAIDELLPIEECVFLSSKEKI